MRKDQYDLTANIQQVIHVLDTPSGNGGTDNEQDDREEREIIHVYPVAGGGVLFTRTPIEEEPLDTAPIYTQPPKSAPTPITPLTIGVLFLSTLIPLSCIIFQLYILFNPPVATLTIIPKSQQVNLTGTLQLGRLLNPITISQSATTQATGKGHQDARQAQGSITFYNGLFTSQSVAAGTILTGSDGVQVITDQLATIPAATENIPPIYGQVTVPAHALNTGTSGNIAADDIHQTCCLPSVLVENATAFHGGQAERNFTTVTQADMNSVSSPLKTTLNQSVQGVLQGQLKSNEALVTPSCTTTVTPDHRPGQEATQVKITASETCSAVAYDTQSLNTSVTQLLTAQAERKLGTGYSLLGNVQATVTAAGAQNKKVVVSFNAQGLWVYALSNEAQEHIKHLIAGKTKEKAMQLLLALPGIKQVSMQWDANTKLPKNVQYIHLVIIAGI